ncbi:MAG: DsbA family protein [Patescibacteria group bacterium]
MNKKNRAIVFGLIIICLILIFGFGIAVISKKKVVNKEVNKNQNQVKQIIVNNNYQTKRVRLIDENDHLWGDKKAPVQMIIYDDFECPFCADFYNTLKQIKAEFGDKIVVAYRHYPLDSHPHALSAAEASECAAEQGKFWEMYDKLFANNKAGLMSLDQFKINAEELEIDQTKFTKCLETGFYKAKVLEQMLEGKNAGVTGTPTIFINNNIYPGAYPFLDFIARDGKQEKGMKSIIGELLK